MGKGNAKVSRDFEQTFSRNGNEEKQGEQAVATINTFQTRFSRDSSKNNILDSLSEFFVSSKSINQRVGGEMRRQRSEMLIDRTSH